MKVFRQPYLVDRLVLNELNRETPSLAVIYKNEFDMAIAAFTLQSTDSKKLKVEQKTFVFGHKKIFLYCVLVIVDHP